LVSLSASANESSHAAAAPRSVAVAALGQLLHDNEQYTKAQPPEHFARFRDHQTPRITLVACSDSRFHVSDIDASPDGDVFVVRNIGNQVYGNLGSFEYGVHHLHTPLVVIVGHVGCGAIKAAMGDYGPESAGVRRELDGLHLSLSGQKAHGSIEEQWLQNVVGNVHQQVRSVTHEYAKEIEAGDLTVVGAVYDFRNDLREGLGRLVVINVNGETDRNIVAHNAILQAAQAASRR
jgi:carbonic anhydrase